MRAEILTIGDELLRGEIVDTNKALLADRLLALDVETRFQTSVGDDPEEMTDAFRRAAGRADLVLVSGGLGPTRDDLTAEVLAKSFGRGLVEDAGALATIRAFFERVGREMTANNAKQAWFPDGAEVLPNPIGTAPGFALEAGGALFFCMPGVPRELERMLDEQVLPRIAKRRGGGEVVRARLLRTFGMGESALDAELADVATSGGVSLGFRTAFPDNYLRPVVRAATEAEAEAKLARVVEAIEKRLGPLIYGRDDETLEQALGALLVARRLSLAVAESCTGGLLAERISAVPGASRYFRGGVVAYADDAKRELLGVPEALLAAHGAVSAPVARAMAEGARARLGADLAVSTTGISGPDGGTPEKPVGLVFVGFASAKESEAHEFLFPFDRARHRLLTSQVALDWVRRALLGEARVAPRWLRGRA
jgi:nicotinamide-nucleotide amidase